MVNKVIIKVHQVDQYTGKNDLPVSFSLKQGVIVNAQQQHLYGLVYMIDVLRNGMRIKYVANLFSKKCSE